MRDERSKRILDVDAIRQMRRRHNFAEMTEADFIRLLVTGAFHIPVALSNRDWKNHKHGPGLY